MKVTSEGRLLWLLSTRLMFMKLKLKMRVLKTVLRLGDGGLMQSDGYRGNWLQLRCFGQGRLMRLKWWMQSK